MIIKNQEKIERDYKASEKKNNLFFGVFLIGLGLLGLVGSWLKNECYLDKLNYCTYNLWLFIPLLFLIIIGAWLMISAISD